MGSRMAMKMLSERLGAKHFARRAFSQGGKVFSEEEKAAENIYIKKMEHEKAEKLARQGHTPEGQKQDFSGDTPGSRTSEHVSADKSKNYAIVAGVVAVVAGIWWYTRSSPKEKEQA